MLKKGDKVLRSDISEESAIENDHPVVFIIEHGGGFYCEESDEAMLIKWNYCVKVPEKKLVEFTFETFPLDKMLVKSKESGVIYSILNIAESAVHTRDFLISYKKLMDRFDFIDPKSRELTPCGIYIDSYG